MNQAQVLSAIRDSRRKGTSSPFVGASDREAEIDRALAQLERSLIEPFPVQVVSAYFPQENCPFIHNAGVYAVAKAKEEYLLYLPETNLFAKAWLRQDHDFTILGFSSGDAIAEWRG